MTLPSKLYLAGPMSGLPGYNYAAFDEATTILRDMGYTVISPAEQDKAYNPVAYERARQSPDGKWRPEDTGGRTWAQVLSTDIILVADEVDALALLPGWERSNGARLEAFVGLLTRKQFALYGQVRTLHWVSNDHIREIMKRNMP